MYNAFRSENYVRRFFVGLFKISIISLAFLRCARDNRADLYRACRARRRTVLSHEYQTDHRGFKRRTNTGEGTAGVLMLIGRLKSRSRIVSPLTSCQSNFRRILLPLGEHSALVPDESKIEFGVHTLRLLACGQALS